MAAASSIEVISNDSLSVVFQITLTQNFNSTNYERVGVTTIRFTDGSDDLTYLEGYAGEVWSTAEFNNSDVVRLEVYTFKPNTTYTLYGFAQTDNGKYYYIPKEETSIPLTTTSGYGGGSGNVSGNGTWKCESITMGKVSGTTRKSIVLNDGWITRYKLFFENSGEASFQIQNPSIETILMLSETPDFDSTKGTPSDRSFVDILVKEGKTSTLTYEVEAGAYYYVWIGAYDLGDSGTATLIITPPSSSQVSLALWDWEVGTGSDKDKAYKAITKQNGYSVSDFKYTVWNALVNKVKDTIDAAGGQWYTSNNEGTVSYLSYGDTLMSSANKILTARRFNTLKFNIGSRDGSGGTGINDVEPKDIVYGSYFISLTTALNNWINKLNNE